jgi:predicted dehydrogenase
MAKLGIGIIGCGNISTSYLRLAPLFKGLKVRAVADINPEAAKARGEEYNVKAQSVEDLLANPEVDVVINLTIPDAHFGVTKRILEAGKHAYSEKPLVLTLKEGVTCATWRRRRALPSAARPTPSLAVRTSRPAPCWTKGRSARSPQARPPS